MKSKSEKEVDAFVIKFKKKYSDVKINVIENNSENFKVNLGNITEEQKKYFFEGLEKIRQKYEKV